MRSADLVRFIKAREAARLGKGKDPIIAKYRFCNVRRNDDRVSKYVLQEIVAPYAGDPFLWFRLVVARLFNNPLTLADIERNVVPFDPKRMADKLFTREAMGLKNFNAAYIVSTNGRTGSKITYLINDVLTPMWKLRHNITAALKGATLDQAHELLMRQNGLGSFMAAQVLADLKYADPSRWEDFDTFAASGPGSKRGLNRVLERSPESPLSEASFRFRLDELYIKVNRLLKWEEPLTAQDLQNCLCEFDKYERARLEEGTPKQLYTPFTEN